MIIIVLRWRHERCTHLRLILKLFKFRRALKLRSLLMFFWEHIRLPKSGFTASWNFLPIKSYQQLSRVTSRSYTDPRKGISLTNFTAECGTKPAAELAQKHYKGSPSAGNNRLHRIDRVKISFCRQCHCADRISQASTLHCTTIFHPLRPCGTLRNTVFISTLSPKSVSRWSIV